MVKNKTGGNKSKKTARKHMNQTGSSYNRKLRLIEEQGENYAAVIKILGGPNCEVICNDGVRRQCIIRNKFRGRDKRDNNISPGVWILVGVRDWEARTSKSTKCDLLEVYTSNEKEKLKTIKSINFTNLIKAFEDDLSKSMDNIVFEDDSISIRKKNIINNNSDNNSDDEIDDVIDDEIDDEIDVDEI